METIKIYGASDDREVSEWQRVTIAAESSTVL